MWKKNGKYITIKDKANGAIFTTEKKTLNANQMMVVGDIEGQKDVISIRTCYAKSFNVSDSKK